ncbi:ion transporter [Psychromonas sp. L1A2]|uniref:ion transporter n=1 Tax=Psychromonas sp. L1A2 TaxID=2686356 RepID=UPI0013576DF8|nr:ion transporter [Psychromonas sp. L1A2]
MDAKKITRSTESDSPINLISVLIIIQCSLFFLEGVINWGSKELINLIQFSIDLIFFIEVIFRLKSLGISFFKSYLNIFDLLLIVASLILFTIPNSNTSTLTILRVFRLIKLLRIITLIPNFEKVLSGVVKALKASRAIFIMLIVLVSFFSILGYLLFSNSIPQHFADPLISAYTVFSLFTVEGWNEIPASVAVKSIDYYLIRTFVISVIIFGSFFALSLANAIFIDEMVLDNNEELEKKVDQLSMQIEKQSEQIEKLLRSAEKRLEK